MALIITDSGQDCKNQLTTIFQFSNKAVETSFETLLQGNTHTTFGTDFNCIAQSILDRGFDKAVIITDGYASLTEENQEQLERRAIRTLTVLFVLVPTVLRGNEVI